MMNGQSSPVEMDQVLTRRMQVARVIMWVSVGATVLPLVVLANSLIGAPYSANTYILLATILVFLLFSSIGLRLIQRQQLNRAIMVYIPGLVVSLTVALYFLGGVTGPVTLGLIVGAVIIGLIGGVKPLRYVSILMGVVYLTMAVLELTQVLPPLPIADTMRWPLEIFLFLNALGVTTVVSGGFINQTERALTAERQRSLELLQTGRQAEQLAVTERELREREGRSAVHLRKTVAGYVDYLSRVAAGDYTARIDVGELDEDVEGDLELHALGEYLNTTVDALVAAITQAQEVQRRYVQQTWQTVVESGRVQPGFAYRQKKITSEAEWLPQMNEAVDKGAPVAQAEVAAVPLVINRQVVGALGGQRPDGRPWTDEELSLIEDVTGQLAQTIESLRLFDDVQRRAVQERLVGEITTRVRESLDMETVLKTAAEQIRESLGAQRVVVRLAQEEMP